MTHLDSINTIGLDQYFGQHPTEYRWSWWSSSRSKKAPSWHQIPVLIPLVYIPFEVLTAFAEALEGDKGQVSSQILQSADREAAK